MARVFDRHSEPMSLAYKVTTSDRPSLQPQMFGLSDADILGLSLSFGLATNYV